MSTSYHGNCSNSSYEGCNISTNRGSCRFGGKPLLQYKNAIVPIIEFTSSICNSKNVKLTVQFTTNASLINHEIISFLNQYGSSFQITLDGGRKYVVNSCYADKRNELLINYNCDIFSCTARDFLPEDRMGKLIEDGSIKWENDALKIKMNSKFKKDVCRKCRIAPICGGGCRQKNMENMHQDKCNLNFSDEQIDDLILERFELYFMNDK